MLVFGPGEPAGKDLTWFDWANDRALSADGKLMLFDESGEGGGPAGGAYLRPTDGAPAVRLGDGVGVALTPDSAWALTRAFSNRSHFVLVPVKIGQPKAFPPDDLGRTAYGDFVAGRFQVRIRRECAGTRQSHLPAGRGGRCAETGERRGHRRDAPLCLAGLALDRRGRSG